MSESCATPKASVRGVQWVMIWGLPLVVVGGLFYAPLGLLAAGMMLALLVLSFFQGRVWCGRVCPRGAFLDIVMQRLTAEKSFPPYLRSLRVRVPLLVVMMSGMAYSLATMEITVETLGGVFVRLCVITTIGAIAMAMVTQRRAWCAVCPMGTSQNLLSRVGPAKRTPALAEGSEAKLVAGAAGNVLVDAEKCRRCGACLRACPMDISAEDFLEVGEITDPDCIRCYECVVACPFEALTIAE